MIEAKFAQIHWNERKIDGLWRVDEVLVFDRRGGVPEEFDYDSSHGACMADWMDGSDPRSTPEGVFASWLRQGFVNATAQAEALLKLSEIEGCGWARTMGEAVRLFVLTYGDEWP